jgi:hypothetical protein
MHKLLLFLLVFSFLASDAQKKIQPVQSDANADSVLLSKTKYRLVGPCAVAAALLLRAVIKIRTRFISALPAAAFGKQPMAAAIGKIFQTNFLEAVLAQ